MPWYPNAYVSGGKPTLERVRQYEAGHAFGLMQKGAADVKEALQAKEDLRFKRRVHQPMIEVWTIKKVRRPYTQEGRWEVDGVRRDPRGRFAAKLSAKETASILAGLTTGADISPPVARKRP